MATEMEAAVTALLNLFGLPGVMDDAVLRRTVSELISNLRRRVSAIKEAPQGGAGGPARAESPCPCGQCGGLL
jgi:hypothetical protein